MTAREPMADTEMQAGQPDRSNLPYCDRCDHVGCRCEELKAEATTRAVADWLPSTADVIAAALSSLPPGMSPATQAANVVAALLAAASTRSPAGPDSSADAVRVLADALDSIGARIHRDVDPESSYLDVGHLDQLADVLTKFTAYADEQLQALDHPAVLAALVEKQPASTPPPAERSVGEVRVSDDDQLQRATMAVARLWAKAGATPTEVAREVLAELATHYPGDGQEGESGPLPPAELAAIQAHASHITDRPGCLFCPDPGDGHEAERERLLTQLLTAVERHPDMPGTVMIEVRQIVNELREYNGPATTEETPEVGRGE